eukprot:TRINITY_DN3645_c0_g1_i2.p1 TRINITY_DN3645_c0_g1~~TRINITY_DN3645_c0_g1_i2.p1  ORF type:complete len:274 (-),score=62.30 TRINITY_DN3645_c0_g1_i2:756-1514(-)
MRVPGSSMSDTPLSGPLMSFDAIKSFDERVECDSDDIVIDLEYECDEQIFDELELEIPGETEYDSEPEDEILEGLGSDKWRKRRKHIFIVTSAGKPVYSRYGDEFKLADIMGAMVAIMSFVSQNGDEIKYVNSGKYKMVFAVHGPFYLIMVANSIESPSSLKVQLKAMHSQLISFLTARAHAILNRTPQYDIKNNMLGGTDRIFDSLADSINYSPSFYFNSIHCLRMSSQIRSIIGNVLLGERKTGILYIFL